MGGSKQQEASSLEAVDLDKRQKVDIKIAFARSTELRGDVDGAIAAYQEALAHDPDRADVYHRVALLYDRKNDPAMARQFYQEALARSPENAEIHCDLGYSAYAQRNWGEAEKSLRTALGLKPNLARAHNNLGLLLARTGRTDEALYEFNQAGLPESQARVNLAFALLLERQMDAAVNQLDLASAQDTGSAHQRICQLRDVIQRTSSTEKAATAPSQTVQLPQSAGPVGQVASR
jgi:Tfp pilus assembly protein PilF